MVSFSSSNVRGLFVYTLDFSSPHKKKSQMLRSGERDGHAMSPKREMTRPRNLLLKNCPILLEPNSVAVEAIYAYFWDQEVFNIVRYRCELTVTVRPFSSKKYGPITQFFVTPHHTVTLPLNSNNNIATLKKCFHNECTALPRHYPHHPPPLTRLTARQRKPSDHFAAPCSIRVSDTTVAEGEAAVTNIALKISSRPPLPVGSKTGSVSLGLAHACRDISDTLSSGSNCECHTDRK
ncbi:hypothetical protein J6590_077811 [Homalodisca vitripennis]|nr:hypothetical protein J6590_077811 [Homalodisca vitripennis]